MSEQGAAPKQSDPTYTTDRLIAEAPDFLGVPSHVAVGAFHGLTKKNLTVSEAKKRVDGWLKTEVETDEPESEEA